MIYKLVEARWSRLDRALLPTVMQKWPDRVLIIKKITMSAGDSGIELSEIDYELLSR